jgi:hypothetical protein
VLVARQYKRDANGRFASGGSTRSAKPAARAASKGANRLTRDNAGRITGTGNGATARGGRLRTASGKQRATQLAKVQRPAGPSGKVRRPVSKGGSGSRPKASAKNTIKRTGTPLLKKPVNTIRPYRPATFDGRMAQGDRQIRGAVKGMSDDLKSLKGRANEMKNWTGRMVARAMADRNKKGIDGDLAGITIKSMGTKYGMPVVRRRAERAAALAAKGSEKGKKALKIYGNQMAFMGPGKPKKKAASNIIPGPRNANPPPKKKRGRRKK